MRVPIRGKFRWYRGFAIALSLLDSGRFSMEEYAVEFEIRPDYTVEDFAAFWHGFREKRPGTKGVQRLSDRGMWRVAWLFFGGGVFLLAVCWLNPLEFQPVPPYMICMGLVFLTLGVLSLIQWRPGRSVPVWPRRAKRCWKKWSGQAPELRWFYRFTPAGMEMHNSTSGHRYDYSQLQQPWEDEEHFYLTLDQKIWHILNKSQFTKGDPDQFAAFLAEQTGKAVRWVDGEKARRGVAL